MNSIQSAKPAPDPTEKANIALKEYDLALSQIIDARKKSSIPKDINLLQTCINDIIKAGQPAIKHIEANECSLSQKRSIAFRLALCDANSIGWQLQKLKVSSEQLVTLRFRHLIEPILDSLCSHALVATEYATR